VSALTGTFYHYVAAVLSLECDRYEYATQVFTVAALFTVVDAVCRMETEEVELASAASAAATAELAAPRGGGDDELACPAEQADLASRVSFSKSSTSPALAAPDKSEAVAKEEGEVGEDGTNLTLTTAASAAPTTTTGTGTGNESETGNGAGGELGAGGVQKKTPALASTFCADLHIAGSPFGFMLRNGIEKGAGPLRVNIHAFAGPSLATLSETMLVGDARLAKARRDVLGYLSELGSGGGGVGGPVLFEENPEGAGEAAEFSVSGHWVDRESATLKCVQFLRQSLGKEYELPPSGKRSKKRFRGR
jgi:hypothetical protein